MEKYLTLDLLNNITIIENTYIFAVLTYLISSLLILLSQNLVYKKFVILFTPIVSGLILFNIDLSTIELNSRIFNLSDLFLQILLILSLCISIQNIKNDSKYHSLVFILVAASIASISTINIIQTFFFYLFICYIPFFTLIKISGNFNKYRTFLITSMVIDLFLIAGLSSFTGENSFIIKDTVKLYIVIPLLLKSSILPFHFLIQSLIPKIDYDIFLIYSLNILIITVYILLQKFSGTTLLLYAGYLTAIYSILFAIVHNDLRYIVNLILISNTSIIICLTGLFSDIFELYEYIISVYFGCGILLLTISDILKKDKKIFLDDCEGLYFRMPWHLISITLATLILIGVPFLSYFSNIQIIVFKIIESSFLYKIFYYLYLSLMMIALLRLHYYFFKKSENKAIHKSFNVSILSIVIMYILMKILYFKNFKLSLAIFSDYFQILVVSLVVFLFLKDIIKSQRGLYTSLSRISGFFENLNKFIIKPSYSKFEKVFNSVLNTPFRIDVPFFKYFDVFEVQILENLHNLNKKIIIYSDEINRVNKLKVRLFTAFTIILLAFLIFLVILNG
jgi:formate hydrogenlyase subunit 3/multisubunit Na+/H+ antiporter MnhD subunit